MDDSQLLQEYTRGSDVAFTTLVRRHLGLVYSVAWRHVHDSALAEDVSQAVFLLLARQAAQLKSDVVLSGWLFRTTCLVGNNVRRKEQRRQQREQEAYEMSQLHSTDDSWQPLIPVIDDALRKLGETDRNTVLLRFAEGQSHREVGRALGLSEEAAKKRLQRALEKLRGLLSASGVTVSAVALTTLLGERLSAAPPSGLDLSVSAAARSAAGQGAAFQLAQEVQRAARWTRVRTAVGILAGAAALWSLWLAVRSSAPSPSPATAEVKQAKVIPGAVAAANVSAPATIFRLTISGSYNSNLRHPSARSLCEAA